MFENTLQDAEADPLVHVPPVGAGDPALAVSAIPTPRPHILQSLLSVVASVTSRPSPSRGAAPGRRGPGGGDGDQQVSGDEAGPGVNAEVEGPVTRCFAWLHI